MYISEIQQRLINAIDASNNILGCLALAVNNGANRSEMTDTYHLALWFEGAPKEVKGKFVQLLELSGFNEIGLRICTNCGSFMTEGYILHGMDWYACSDSCAVALYMNDYRKRIGMNQAPAEARRDLNYDLDHYPDDNFWTEWVQEL